MKYFLDCEFIEGFHTPFMGKRRHYIDLISIGIQCEDGRSLSFISKEYNFNDASKWVKDNVIQPLYLQVVHGDARNRFNIYDFHRYYGTSNEEIAKRIAEFIGCWRDQLFWRAPEGVEMYGYYADYDWVLVCSLFGRMIDLPKGFPMYCIDLKQQMDEKAAAIDQLKLTKYVAAKNDKWEVTGPIDTRIININDYTASMKLELLKGHKDYPKQHNEHNALADAAWNYELYKFLQTI